MQARAGGVLEFEQGRDWPSAAQSRGAARPSAVAPSAEAYATIVACVQEAWAAGRGTWIASRDLEWLSHRLGLKTHERDLTPRVWFGPGRVGPIERAAMRALALAVALGVLAVLSPLWIAIALFVKLDGGPVLYRSRRAGRGGVPFELVKFRTMTAADDDGHEDARRRSRGAIIRGAFPEFVDHFGRRVTKDPRDKRVTRLGRLLRSTSLDEIPQLLHVVTGRMALVGPRPYVLDEVACFKPWHHARHAGLPGVTGLWQVSGRSTVGFDESVLLDLYYLANRSFWLDLRIVARTPFSMLLGRGAH